MIIDNKIMIDAFDNADKVKFYHWCVDLSLAGEDYKITEIVCFTNDQDNPLSDFAQVKKYDAGFLLILLYTEDEALIRECMDYVDMVKAEFDEINLRTPYPSVLDSERIRKYYIAEYAEHPANPVYYIHSADKLAIYTENTNASVSLFCDADKDEIIQAVQEGKLDQESMNGDMFEPYTCFKDTKWYILRVDGEIAGYLRGECGYANIYDIGWVYVEPRFRGHGYAVNLVLKFSHDMFETGMIPHYGYAISESSARVAEKCGYTYDKIKIECRILKPIQ